MTNPYQPPDAPTLSATTCSNALRGLVAGIAFYILSCVTIGTFISPIQGIIAVGFGGGIGASINSRFLGGALAMIIAGLLTANTNGDWIIYSGLSVLASLVGRPVINTVE